MQPLNNASTLFFLIFCLTCDKLASYNYMYLVKRAISSFPKKIFFWNFGSPFLGGGVFSHCTRLPPKHIISTLSKKKSFTWTPAVEQWTKNGKNAINQMKKKIKLVKRVKRVLSFKNCMYLFERCDFHFVSQLFEKNKC